jgi:serine/threonine protein kinase
MKWSWTGPSTGIISGAVSSAGHTCSGTVGRVVDQGVERTVIIDSNDISSMLPYAARYEIRRRLWLDGLHAGWDAYDRVLQREVVLNVAYRLTDAPRLVEKARTLARLQHANILPLLDLGITGEGLPFFTMAKMDWQKWQPLDSIGERLAERGAAAGPDPVKPLIGGVRDVCRAVNYARSRGIVNSDLYPGCILFGSDLRDVLVVEEWERVRDEDATGEGCGRALFRLPYASPEQVRKSSALISPASDVFHVGGVLHFVLYAIPPNHLPGAAGIPDLYRAIVEGRFEARKPATLRPGLRSRGILGRRAIRHLEQICLKALDANPARRHRDAGELGRDLDTWLGSI